MHLQTDGKILLAGEKDFDFYAAHLLNDVGVVIENVNPFSSLFLFPNPVSDQLIIKHSQKLQENATVIITNVLGKVVQQQALN